MTPTLTLREFLWHLQECGFYAVEVKAVPKNKGLMALEEVVIRTPDGDAACCAVHREGARLVLDLGQPIKE